MLKPFTAVLTTVAMVLSVGAVSSITVPASAAPSTAKKVLVQEGARTVVDGQVPNKFASRLVVLEAYANKGKKRMELGSGVSDSVAGFLYLWSSVALVSIRRVGV
jgi:hypothetical protein